MFEKISKRNGNVVEFDSLKITAAIAKAGKATGEFGEVEAEKFTMRVLNLVHESHLGSFPDVEAIQDIVEKVLFDTAFFRSAKAYILYREQHAQIRAIAAKASVNLVDNYLKQLD
jgi:ribonucleoside-triphosphate reductase